MSLAEILPLPSVRHRQRKKITYGTYKALSPMENIFDFKIFQIVSLTSTNCVLRNWIGFSGNNILHLDKISNRGFTVRTSRYISGEILYMYLLS